MTLLLALGMVTLTRVAIWAYPDAAMASITSFEVKLGTATSYTRIGIPAKERLATTPTGAHSYAWPIGTATTATVRACTAARVCSSSVTATYRPLVPPTGLRIVR